MASGKISKNSLSAILMILLLFLQVFAIILEKNVDDSTSELADLNREFNSQTLSDFELDFGIDLSGKYVDFDDIAQGLVRHDSELDIYHTEILQESNLGTAVASDIAMSKQQEVNACWINNQGSVHYYWSDINDETKINQVDIILGQSDGVVDFDCSIAVKDNGRASMLYPNGSDLKAGQIAYASSLYTNGDEWHTRTILEDVNVTNIELAITPDYFEWGVFRNDQGELHRINYTGAFWETGLIEQGPVGEDFELEITSAGIVYILYTKANQAILSTISEGIQSSQVIVDSANLHSDVGMTLDGSELLQLFTSKAEENQTILSIERSLANQDNQISSIPKFSLYSDLTGTNSGDIFMADFNLDGLDDIVYSEPESSTLTFTNNGRVSVHYSSQTGVSSVANLTWEGGSDNEMLGKGLSIGDYNGDGINDIAIGSPGVSNNDGLVEFAFGSQQGLSETLIQAAGISTPDVSGDKYGHCLETVDDMNGDGYDEILICSIDYEQSSDTGKVELFFGNDVGQTWVKMNSPNQMLQGSNFGQSISADGDLNGDGLSDLVIGNTGTLDDSSGFSSVEVRYGTSTGFNLNPDYEYQSFTANTLFGYQVNIINDLNDDGFDELFISEPYNTTAPFNSGDVWVFYGNSTGVAEDPNVRLKGNANDLLGLNVASAGDTNSDGFNDLLITRKNGFNQGKVELILGSSETIDGSSYVVATGSANFGHTISNPGDSDGDELSEFIFNSQYENENQNLLLALESYSRKLFDITEISLWGESLDGKIHSSSDGKPRIVLDLQNTTDMSINTNMLSLETNSQSTFWTSREITKSQSMHHLTTNFELTSSGSPMVLYHLNDLRIKTYSGFTAVQSEITTSSSDVKFVTSVNGLSGETYLAYYSPSLDTIYVNERTNQGWNEQVVATGVSISSPILLQVNNTGSPVIVYIDDLDKELNVATVNGTWSVSNITTKGMINAPSFSCVVDYHDNVIISTMIDDGSYNNLSVITFNRSSITIDFIAVESDQNTNLSLLKDGNNDLTLATLTSGGSLIVYEKANNTNSWSSILLPQPQLVSSANSINSISGNIPIIAVNSEINSVYAKVTGTWQIIADAFANNIEDFDIIKNNQHLIIMSKHQDSDSIHWSSMEFSETSSLDKPWHQSMFDNLNLDDDFTTTMQNGMVSLLVKSSSNNFITNIELFVDTDNDHIFDDIDELDNAANQWSDNDGDGYGDNNNAPLYDDCPTQSGTSRILVLGCFDADGDGYDDLTDDCNTAYGVSWLGRFGCSDFDQDGWVDWNSLYPYGDIFSDNWKQAFDSDGDSYGDNHGPDCCDTWYDDNAPSGDQFPFDPKQYSDYDGDGYGDNSSDFIGGDACKFDYGTSYLDRLGCHDSDGDGASDPSTFWNASMGADIWPDDATQWVDSDGDGYGDNSSQNATYPDSFPDNIAAANDTDGDGYPDIFTDYYNGSNAQGLRIDGCPLVAGNSTNPFYGCIDSDGDNYRDIYTFDVNPLTGLRENQTGDAFPLDKNQWADADGDGFGDFQGGELADICPNAPGVLNGTLGIGCPLIDGNDDDGDFVINENDLCPGTQFGLLVDLNGCATNQLDADSDGITDDVDICPNTANVDFADENGCSEAQRQVDTDSDGVYDYLDQCQNTPSSEISDSTGCSLSQKDTDSDGITDDIDVCLDTPENYPVLADGCTDESAKEIDWDEDGYTGEDDEFMFEPTQWADSDGDGYGDNSEGVDGDQCPQVSGNSTVDRLGCLDTDADGYSDPSANFAASPSGLADAFINDATQWHDIDGDGYGDNSSGLNPDLCPTTNPLYRISVDLFGCAPNERDTDNDGVVDSLDNCPTQAKGINGYSDGCPLEEQTESSASNEILGLPVTWFIGVIAAILLLLILIIRRRNRVFDDEDWFDEDEDNEDDYFEEDKLSFLDRNQRKTQPRAPARQQISGPTSPPQSGPVGAPLPRTNEAPKPPVKVNAPTSGPPRFSPQAVPQSTPKPAGKKVAKKVKKTEDSGKKVRRAVAEAENDIFENVPQSAIDESIDEISNYSLDNERQLLMYLQEKGWNAPQSRAIINMIKNKSK